MVSDDGWDRAVEVEPRGDRGARATGGTQVSRRIFLIGGSAAAAMGVIAGCSGAKPLREQVRGGGKVSPADVEQLNALLDVEHYAITAYAAGIPLLLTPQGGQTPESKAAAWFLAQELAHASQLTDLIHRARGKPIRRQASYDLGHPKGPADAMALLLRLERLQLTAYLRAIPRLSGGHVRAAVAAIFANDAQHLALLRWHRGEAPAPAARVTGQYE